MRTVISKLLMPLVAAFMIIGGSVQAGAVTLPSWGIGADSCAGNTFTVYLEPGQSLNCTIGAEPFGVSGAPEFLAVQGIQSPGGSIVAPVGASGQSTPFIPSVIGPVIPVRTVQLVPFTITVPLGTVPGEYQVYYVLTNPQVINCPVGSTVCANVATQVASPLEIVVLNPDGSAPGPLTEAPTGITTLGEGWQLWSPQWAPPPQGEAALVCPYANPNECFVPAAQPVGGIANTSAENVFGVVQFQFTITYEKTGQTWSLGPFSEGAILQGITLGASVGSDQIWSNNLLPTGEYLATECVTPLATNCITTQIDDTYNYTP